MFSMIDFLSTSRWFRCGTVTPVHPQSLFNRPCDFAVGMSHRQSSVPQQKEQQILLVKS